LEKSIQYIAIAGNIGVGKSTLTALLSKHFNWEAFYESVEDNPYLKDFYEDMSRWSFNLQIYFLSSRFKRQKNILSNNISFIQDRTIYEDVEIFAKNLHEMALMSDRDFDNYRALFKEMSDYIQPPNLLIYLRASVPTLVKQIQSRGRDYESSIRLDYLERLNRLYDQWIDNYPHDKLIIDTDHLDFVTNQEDLGYVISLIERRLFNLFT
jgi:deoxyadenosine/deoxycytidine kinase